MSTKTFEKLDTFISNFDTTVSRLEAAVRPIKEALVTKIAQTFEETAGKDMARAVELMTLNAKLGERSLETLKSAKIDTTNIKTLEDLIIKLGEKAQDGGVSRASMEALVKTLGVQLEYVLKGANLVGGGPN